MNKMFSQACIRQLFSYFCVGGISALVEWVLFALFTDLIGMNYILSTCLAFVFSTLTNLYLGKVWTFKESRTYEKRLYLEVLIIFFVSGVGLLLNIAFMCLFVSVMGMRSSVLKICSKVVATGIVFIWNFLIRRYVIYGKEN